MAASMADMKVGVGTDLSKFDSGMNHVDSRMAQSQERVNGLGGAMNRAQGPSRALALGLLGVGAGMGVLALKAVGLSSNMEQTRIAFTTMLKSATAADAFIRELQKFAATTPFEFAGLTKTAQQLMAMGFQAKTIIPTMTAIGNATSALGGSQETIDHITLAMGQMQAKGKVAGDDVRQLAEAGIPVWKYLAKAIGTDIPTAMKRAQTTGISSSIGISAIIAGMNRDFGGMMEKQSHTMIGIWSNIQDAIGQSLTIVGGMITNAFDLKGKLAGAMGFLQSFQTALSTGRWDTFLAKMAPGVAWLDAWDRARAAFNNFRTGLTEVGNAIGPTMKKIADPIMAFIRDHPDIAMVALAGAVGGLLVPAIFALAVATGAWVIAAAPFLLVGGAIAVLAYLLVGHWKEVTNWIHSTIMAHQNLINIVLALAGPIGGVIKIVALLVDNWKDVAKWIGNVIAKIIDLIGWIGRIDFSKIPILGGVAGAVGSLISGVRDWGGPVTAGRTYVVGGRGPELFQPNQSGTIHPNLAGVGGTTILPVVFSPIPPNREQLVYINEQLRRLKHELT